MKILFIQGGSRLKLAENGKWYTDGNFTDEVWERYISLCDTFTIVLRREQKVYSVNEAENRFNKVLDNPKIRVVALDDITHPKSNMINPIVRHRIRKTILEEVEKADKCIIRSCSFYTIAAYDACKKYHKPYLMEVAGFIKEGLQHHSLLGKMIASSYEAKFKVMTKEASAAIYVTNDALQKRYPSKGEMLGCSDVLLHEFDETLLENRKTKVKQEHIIRVGTAAFLDVKWKGQENVIKALAVLKEKGKTNVIYELIGIGEGLRLKKLATKLGVEDQVKFLGAKNHDEVFKWIDNLDIYIQPSYQEGLCRAIVEAMSRACPVICSDIGGNYELIDDQYLFQCGDFHKLADLIECMSSDFANQATRNFSKSKAYDKNRLDILRNNFLKDFIER